MCSNPKVAGIFKTLLYYRTVKVVQIRNMKLGALHLFMQLLIFIYVVIYVIIIEKGYNGSSPIEGYTYTKLKGSSLQNDTYGNILVWDATDIVNPPMESDAIFVTTNSLVTYNQSRGLYPDTATPCPCEKGVTLEHGVETGTCTNVTDSESYCQIYGWGPVEDDITAASTTVLNSVQNFTMFVRCSVVFSRYKIRDDNLLGGNLTMGYNEFYVSDFIKNAGSTWDDVATTGAIIATTISWNCEFNPWSPDCEPQFKFFRLDQSNSFSPGFNYRYGHYYYLPNQNDTTQATQYRDLFKVYGVRIVFLLAGQGHKFSIIPLMLNLASGLALLTIATIISDVLTLYILPNSKRYRSAKIKAVEAEKEKDEEDPMFPTENTSLYQNSVNSIDKTA